jgi:hypothetical protein
MESGYSTLHPEDQAEDQPYGTMLLTMPGCGNTLVIGRLRLFAAPLQYWIEEALMIQSRN